MTEMTTSTSAVQRVTAMSDTHAMRRLRRYLRIRWSLYIGRLYGPHEREQNHVPYRLGACEHHEQAINAEPHAPRGGHAVAQGGEEVFVELVLLFLVADLVGEMFGLHIRVVQFGIAGGDFDAVDGQLVDIGEE